MAENSHDQFKGPGWYEVEGTGLAVNVKCMGASGVPEINSLPSEANVKWTMLSSGIEIVGQFDSAKQASDEINRRKKNLPENTHVIVRDENRHTEEHHVVAEQSYLFK